MGKDGGGCPAASAGAQKKKGRWGNFGRKKGGENTDGGETGTVGTAKGEGSGNVMSANQVPTTYNEMFRFNSAVMGFGTSQWMGEVLDCFNNIVTNVANSARLQEECDILVLRI